MLVKIPNDILPIVLQFFPWNDFLSVTKASTLLFLLKNLEVFEKLSGDQIFNDRKTKFLKIGRDQGFKKPSDSLGEQLAYVEPGMSKIIRFIQERKNLL